MSIRIKRLTRMRPLGRARGFFLTCLVFVLGAGVLRVRSERPVFDWSRIWHGSSAPRLEAESAVLLDPFSRCVIYQKRAYKRMYPASTTKILTALIAVENSGPNESVTVGREIRLVPQDGSTAGLSEGERMPMRDVVYALMLPSGADAAYVIAHHTARKRVGARRDEVNGAISFFVKKMNQRAAEAGARGSHFVNPDGYHDPGHYSTAYDLSLIASEAMRFPVFRRVVSRRSYTQSIPKIMPRTTKERRDARALERPRVWANRNLLLDPQSSFHAPGADGIKTGHTANAGYCLVASATRQRRRLIAVVLNSTRDGVWKDAVSLLDYGFDVTASADARKK